MFFMGTKASVVKEGPREARWQRLGSDVFVFRRLEMWKIVCHSWSLGPVRSLPANSAVRFFLYPAAAPKTK